MNTIIGLSFQTLSEFSYSITIGFLEDFEAGAL